MFVAAAGKLVAYDTDGDGDFDVEDAKVLLGKFSFHFPIMLIIVVTSLCNQRPTRTPDKLSAISCFQSFYNRQIKEQIK